MTHAAAHHSPAGAVEAPRTAQRPSGTVTVSIQARASEDHERIAGPADREPRQGRNARDLDDVACKSLLGIAMAADSIASRQWSADPHLLDDKLRQLARLARQAVILARSAADDRHDDATGGAVRSPVRATGPADDMSAGPAALPASQMTEMLGKEIIGVLREALINAEVGTPASQAQVALRMAAGLLLTEVVMLDWTDDARRLDPGRLIRVVLNAARRDPGASGRADPFLAGPLRARDPAERSHPVALRPREREIMQFIAEGLSNRQIAARLVISEKTVKNHICSIYQRLGVHGRSQAISQWRDQ